jgi:hypothetical protein
MVERHPYGGKTGKAEISHDGRHLARRRQCAAPRARAARPVVDRRGNEHPSDVGADAYVWHLYPEHYAVLTGTQDMLLSRAGLTRIDER